LIEIRGTATPAPAGAKPEKAKEEIVPVSGE
jgi:hypothetical protein